MLSDNPIRNEMLTFLHNVISRNENPISFYKIIGERNIYEVSSDELDTLYNLCNR